MTRKTIKTVFIPEIVVDITDCNTPQDIYLAFADAKIEKYLNCMEKDACDSDAVYNDCCELDDKITNAANAATMALYDLLTKKKEESTEEDPTPVKKPGVLKRFWNWITRKK